ncbi:hypothetical protein FHG55_17780 [Pseudomonas jessenii]|uniref:Uncharacterized protein n=1 Tax=Pseudomonas jessenii TaxID=77298 RepID=A0A5C4KX09_PSEJE|nr:hypothetical protein FHG55_17780 [Pseudomonas jessenii]
MSSFHALLSTDLIGSYSQGLIHINQLNDWLAGKGNPPRARESARHWRKELRNEECRQAANGPVCEQQKGYLPMQKLEKIRPSRSSELNAPVISPRECWA